MTMRNRYMAVVTAAFFLLVAMANPNARPLMGHCSIELAWTYVLAELAVILQRRKTRRQTLQELITKCYQDPDDCPANRDNQAVGTNVADHPCPDRRRAAGQATARGVRTRHLPCRMDRRRQTDCQVV